MSSREDLRELLMRNEVFDEMLGVVLALPLEFISIIVRERADRRAETFVGAPYISVLLEGRAGMEFELRKFLAVLEVDGAAAADDVFAELETTAAAVVADRRRLVFDVAF